MWFGVVTLFPEMVRALTDYGVVGRAESQGLIDVCTFNPRDFTKDKHRTVDDRPYGGGPGMLMKVQPLQDAIQAAKEKANGPVRVIYLSPQGRVLDQSAVCELAGSERLVLVSGRYEGVDERLIEAEVDEEWSIGNYVLTGGELPAMVMIDAISRFVPGVLGDNESAKEDSFVSGLLDHPHYTRPEEFENRKVPEVLLSGHHDNIRRWRLKQSLGRTWQRRPDLFKQVKLTAEEQKLLQDFIEEAACSKPAL